MDDFVSILHTVKRKDRTNQLKVLAALYSLGGLEKPVDSSDVRDLIELHLPKKEVPINIPGKLRSYSAYVRLSGKGLPLRWLLMDAGLQELRERTGLSLAKKKELRFDSDIGFVCALEQPEFVALHAALGAEANWKEIGSPQYAHVYREAVLVAMDTCDSLLQELEVLKESLPIRAVNADLLAFREHVGSPIDVILCMGDTLTHLPSLSDVESLFTDVAASLSHGGLFVATFATMFPCPCKAT